MQSFDDRNTTGGTEDVQRRGETDWTRIEALTGEQALQNAVADPDNPPLTDEQLARMRRVPNPQEIRQRLGLTQREFATQFQIALGTLRDWEQGARRPDSAAKAYLRVIAAAPDAVRRILQTEGDHGSATAAGIRHQSP
jgi:putative transcriptional regulator